MIATRKILLTGTHITPAVELIHQLHADTDFHWQISYIGRRYNSSTSTDPSIESKIIPNLRVKFYGILCGKFDRRWLPNTLKGIPQIFSGFFDAYKILSTFKPTVVVSFGGYVSVPVIFAAWLLGIKSITHEQTKTLSLSTRLSTPFSQFIALSFPHRSTHPKYVLTGNLLRRDIFKSTSKKYKKYENLLKKIPLIYLTAGNQGSQHLNQNLKEILPQLSQKNLIIHQTGDKDFPKYKKLSSTYLHYLPTAFVTTDDIGWIFKHAHLIISRAGANTIQEIAVIGKNSIIIPLPVSQQDEQLKNALWLKRKFPQHTIIIKDDQLTPQTLLKSIQILLKKKGPCLKVEAKPNLKLLKLIKKL